LPVGCFLNKRKEKEKEELAREKGEIKMRITNTEVLNTIKDVFANIEGVEEDMAAAVEEYCNIQLNSIVKKANNAKERNAHKEPKEDTLKAQVLEVLPTDFVEMEVILSALAAQGLEVTKSQVASRIGKLIKEGLAVKEVTRSAKTQVTTYKKVA
jgi:hypothetical protein